MPSDLTIIEQLTPSKTDLLRKEGWSKREAKRMVYGKKGARKPHNLGRPRYRAKKRTETRDE